MKKKMIKLDIVGIFYEVAKNLTLNSAINSIEKIKEKLNIDFNFTEIEVSKTITEESIIYYAIIYKYDSNKPTYIAARIHADINSSEDSIMDLPISEWLLKYNDEYLEIIEIIQEEDTSQQLDEHFHDYSIENIYEMVRNETDLYTAFTIMSDNNIYSMLQVTTIKDYEKNNKKYKLVNANIFTSPNGMYRIEAIMTRPECFTENDFSEFEIHEWNLIEDNKVIDKTIPLPAKFS